MKLDFEKDFQLGDIVEKATRELAEIARRKTEMMVIDDIIDIYNAKYTDFSQYIQIKGEQHNEWEKSFYSAFDNKSVFYYELEPIVLSHEIFNYIKSKKEVEDND